VRIDRPRWARFAEVAEVVGPLVRHLECYATFPTTILPHFDSLTHLVLHIDTNAALSKFAASLVSRQSIPVVIVVGGTDMLGSPSMRPAVATAFALGLFPVHGLRQVGLFGLHDVVLYAAILRRLMESASLTSLCIDAPPIYPPSPLPPWLSPKGSMPNLRQLTFRRASWLQFVQLIALTGHLPALDALTLQDLVAPTALPGTESVVVLPLRTITPLLTHVRIIDGEDIAGAINSVAYTRSLVSFHLATDVPIGSQIYDTRQLIPILDRLPLLEHFHLCLPHPRMRELYGNGTDPRRLADIRQLWRTGGHLIAELRARRIGFTYSHGRPLASMDLIPLDEVPDGGGHPLDQ
jgi:hypothetical protein